MSNIATEELITSLKTRFEANMQWHKGIVWEKVVAKLVESPEKLRIIGEMERTGGEPDVVKLGGVTGECVFVDCSKETPKDRRNICYDQQALEARKTFKPKDSAMNMAETMGIEILTEEQYKALQLVGEFDTKTSSWLQTPAEIRKLGGAIFADRRYNHVFVYHNGADSYYGVRGFRGLLRI